MKLDVAVMLSSTRLNRAPHYRLGHTSTMIGKSPTREQSNGMMRRILLWTIVGCLVAGLWTIYAAATFPNQLISAGPIFWTLVNVTCPIAFMSLHFHFGVKLYWVVLANAATYALIGLAVESLRHQLSHAK